MKHVQPTTATTVPVRQIDRGRAFLSDHPLRSVLIDGRPGYAVSVRLTSYRSLPLSCLERITLIVDGAQVESGDIRFGLNSHQYRLEELERHSEIWWFVLDEAELLVSPAQPLSAGEHLVEGALVTVEPYVSNGRFHFTSRATRTLTLDPTEVAR